MEQSKFTYSPSKPKPGLFNRELKGLYGLSIIFLLIIIYFISGKLSLSFAFLNQSVSPIWLPTGISLTAFIIFGFRIWPAVFIGAFLVNITTAGTVFTTLGMAAGNTLEGITGLYLINKFIGAKNIFERPLNIFKYIFLAGITATFLSAIIGVTFLYLENLIAPNNFYMVLLTWWLGDLGGVLIVAPVLLLWISDYKINRRPLKILEAVSIFLLLIITNLLIFENLKNIKLPFIINQYPFTFITIPILLLIAFRFSMRETATAILIFTTIALMGTLRGSYRLSFDNTNLSLINIQIIVIFIFFTIMPVSAAITRQRKLEEELRESEERYRTLAETASDVIISINEESRILFCNPVIEKVFGYKTEELLNKDLTILMPDRFKLAHKEGIKHFLQTGTGNIPWTAFEIVGLHKNGNEIPLEISFSKFSKNRTTIFTGIIRDITERKNAQLQMENSLRLLEMNEARYKNIFNTAGVSIWEQDFTEVKILIDNLKANGIIDFRKYFDENEDIVKKAVSLVKIIDINDQTLKVFKAKSKSEILSSLNSIFLPETLSAFKEELITIAEGKNYLEAETVERNLEGEKINVLFTIRFPDNNDFRNVLVSIMDITESKKAEETIQASLNEKEILIKEIHHRVKNNLQIISSLLSLQSNKVSEGSFQDFFVKSQNRIKSIAIIHEMLYKSENLSKINFKNYVDELSKYIAVSYSAGKIKINVISEEIYFDIDITINLGLIINEIISNSIKHAFNDTKQGKITVELKNEKNYYSLNIKDDGKGLPHKFDLTESKTLGMHLIANLVLQIDGKMEIKNNVGTEYLISFKMD